MEHGVGGLRAAAAAGAARVPVTQPDASFSGGSSKPYHKSKSYTWDAGTFANEILPTLTMELAQMGRARNDSVGSAALGGTPIGNEDDFPPPMSSSPPLPPSTSKGRRQLSDTSHAHPHPHRRVMSTSTRVSHSTGFSSFPPEDDNPATYNGDGEELGASTMLSPLKFDIGPVPVSARPYPTRSHGPSSSFGAPGDSMFLGSTIAESHRNKQGGDFNASGLNIADPPAGSARPPHKRSVTFGGMPDLSSPEAAFTSGLRQFDVAGDGGADDKNPHAWGNKYEDRQGSSGDISPTDSSRTPSPLQSPQDQHYGGYSPELQQHVPANMMMDSGSGSEFGGGSWKSMVTGPYQDQQQQHSQYPPPMSHTSRGHQQHRDPNMHHSQDSPTPLSFAHGGGGGMNMHTGSEWTGSMNGDLHNGGGIGMPPMPNAPFPASLAQSGLGDMMNMPPPPGSLNRNGGPQTPQQQQMYVQHMANLVFLQQQYMQAYMQSNGGQMPPKSDMDRQQHNMHHGGIPMSPPYMQQNNRRGNQQHGYPSQGGYPQGGGGRQQQQQRGGERGQGRNKQRDQFARNDGGNRRDSKGGRNYNIPHHDSGMGSNVVSNACPSLAEYKMSGRRPTMEELAGHVVEFSRDAHGSRFVQFKMEIATNEEKDQLINEVLDEAVSLMQDTFGNYVVQNFLEHGTPAQRNKLAEAMYGSMFALSAQAHGCRVVQRAFDLLELPERNKLLAELLMPHGNVSRSARNSHATHVLQKAVNILIAENRNAVNEAARLEAQKSFDIAPSSRELLTAVEKAVFDDFETLAVHPHAYRLVLHVLGNCSPELSPWVVKAMQVIESMRMALATDQHGNFILQHILDKATPALAGQVQAFVCENLFELSQHKFGSHLVEKCIACSTGPQSKALIAELLQPTDQNLSFAEGAINAAHGTGSGVLASGVNISPLVLLMQDPYANFVVQKAFDKSAGDQRVSLYDEITSRTDVLSKFTYGRHILSHINREIGGAGNTRGAGGAGGGGGGGGGNYNNRR